MVYDRDPEQALALAIIQINRYRGYPRLKPPVLQFTRQAVSDALVIGPSPMTPSWVKYTLAATSGLTRWSEERGVPLERRLVFSEENVRRWLEGTDRTSGGAASYRSQLSQLTTLFAASAPRMRDWTIARRGNVDEPHTPREVAQMWHWSAGLEPTTRHRVRAYLALGLGCGFKLEDKARLTRDDVVIDADGSVHVTRVDITTGELRTVTCLVDWEHELAALVRATPPGRSVLAPWLAEPTPAHSALNAVERARRRSCPVHFNGRSLRNTWTVAHLAAGTPIGVLRHALGIKTIANFEHLLAWVPDVDPLTEQRLLRGFYAHENNTPDEPHHGA